MSSVQTEWERVSAHTRWGRYRSALQSESLELADALVGIGGTALDLGCGPGRWSAKLHEHGWDVVCGDINPGQLAICQERVREAECVLLDPDAQQLPFADRSARLIVVFEVPPLTQAQWFPREAARVLTPDGALVCTFHNPLSWRGAAVRLHSSVSSARRARTWGPYEGPTYSQFRRALRNQGLTIAREQGSGWAPLTSSSDSRLVDGFSKLERMAGLRRLPVLSPTIAVVAVRS